MNMNGAVIYKGPSMLDGSPIMAVLSGLQADSTNEKTGAMVQSYILRSDVHPVLAVQTGADAAICGDCKHRGDSINGRGRTCYVEVGKGASMVWGAANRGVYIDARIDASHLVAGRIVRLGTYGDPAAVPVDVWQRLISRAVAWTGYTHAWRGAGAPLRKLCMASVDSEAEMAEARALGWRTFRVVTRTDEVQRFKHESPCPASAEAGRKLTCIDCTACDGASSTKRGSIVIQAHGGAAVMANVRRRYRTLAAG